MNGSIEHPALMRLTRSTRRAVDEALDRVEVVAANGFRLTRTARANGWTSDWEALRQKCTPCFTLSAGRSGTMTLALLARMCPDLEAVHEPAPNLVTASFFADQGLYSNTTFWDDCVAEARDWPIRSALRRGRSWFETNNRMSLLAAPLAERYPAARFVVLVRHPAAFAESALDRGYYENHPWDFARPIPRSTDDWDEREQVLKVAWLWFHTYETVLAITDSLDPRRVKIVRSEDLFVNRDNVALETLRFGGAMVTPTKQSVETVLGRPANAQPGERGAHGAWGSRHTVDRFYGLVGPLMERFGYARLATHA